MCVHIFNLLIGLMHMFYIIFVGSILFKEKLSFNKNYILAMTLYLISFCLENYYFSYIYNIFLEYLIIVLFYMVVYKCDMFKIMTNSLGAYMLCNVLNSIIYIIVKVINIDVFLTMNCWIYLIKIIIIFLSFIILIVLKKYIFQLLNIIYKHKKRDFILFIALCFNFILSFLVTYSNIRVNYRFIIDFVIILIVIKVSIFLVNRENRIKSLEKFYEEMCEYSKINEDLILDYRMAIHENKNKLIIIKNMIEDRSDEVFEYIDSLINEKIDIKNSYLLDLKNIPFSGIKNFINYKLMKMRNMGAHIELVISEELESIEEQLLTLEQQKDLYTILGVILDNMIDSLEEQSKKLVSIQMYLDNNYIHCEFVNSFVGTIDLDKLNILGYSTKGKERGVGLSLLENIVNNNECITVKSEIVDKFFIQHVFILSHKKIKS